MTGCPEAPGSGTPSRFDTTHPRTIVFTGVSGGGKTTALRAVEDLGYYCVDNLPLPLLDGFRRAMDEEAGVDRVALVIDARLRRYISGYAQAISELKYAQGLSEVVYFDARDDVLVRRFSQTRRRHPMEGSDIVAGVREERSLLEPILAQATTCIDTSDLTVHQLKELIQQRYRSDGNQLIVSLVSFGFRYGIPTHADLVFDVRFLPNPYFVEELRDLNGQHSAVADFVTSRRESTEFVSRIGDLLAYLLPLYQAEGKAYLTIAIGCTGGRHRSVAIAELVSRVIASGHSVHLDHRDIVR